MQNSVQTDRVSNRLHAQARLQPQRPEAGQHTLQQQHSNSKTH